MSNQLSYYYWDILGLCRAPQTGVFWLDVSLEPQKRGENKCGYGLKLVELEKREMFLSA
jgi:hypothetical protein